MGFLSYQSVRFIQVNNWRLGLIYYSLQLLVLLYIIVYSIIIKKGYQEFETVVGGIAVKVKGTASSNGTIFDSYDLVQPPTESSALFITTQLMQTLNQKRDICPGNDIKLEACIADKNCKAGEYTPNGIKLGKCDASGYCLLNAWCPLENEKKGYLLGGVDKWTIFLKTNIEYPKFHVLRSNVDQGLETGVNLFTVGDIITQSGYNYSDINHSGAVILCSIAWNCNLDKSQDKCQPSFQFRRIDDPGSKFSSGFNYRYVDRFYGADGTPFRNLNKAYGIRLLFTVYGVGGKFGIVPLLITLGAGLGLLSISTLICDFLLQYWDPNKNVYVASKFTEIKEEEEKGSNTERQRILNNNNNNNNNNT